MDLETFKCPYCVRVLPSLEGLRKHCRKHKINAKQLYVALFCNGVEPTCKCGCKEPVKFLTINEGFSTYKRGHISRIKNNWGHNAEALDRSHATTKRRYDAGEIHAWNKGATKETDERVARYGSQGSQTILNQPFERQRRSKGIKQLWKIGAITPLTGSAHSQWKGGVSSVQQLCRSYVFNVWTYPKLLASSFTCQGCGSKCDLEVHHDGERFAAILQKAREALGDVSDSFESHQAYARWVADYHVQNDVSGTVLCEQCHLSAHASDKVPSGLNNFG